MVSYDTIDEMVAPLGFCLRGGFEEAGAYYVLVGNVGSDLWRQFGIQYDDWVEPDPLDHYTRREIDIVADKLNADAIYPFDGPVHAPFQTWAKRADTVYASPIGSLIHPKYGLWHAYRACLVFQEKVEGIPQVAHGMSPCEKCFSKPCLSSCPVDAFSKEDFAFMRCIDYLNKNLEGPCMHNGCLARQACPIGKEHAYMRDHGAFHMERFLQALNRKSMDS